MILTQKTANVRVNAFWTKLNDFAKFSKRIVPPETIENNSAKLTKFFTRKEAYVIWLRFLTPLKKASHTSGLMVKNMFSPMKFWMLVASYSSSFSLFKRL